jgi:hypothetical protein
MIADWGTALVIPESGRWVVHTVVAFPDEICTARINDYHTEDRANIAASLIHRAMNRSRT